jgi:hypothetical protein
MDRASWNKEDIACPERYRRLSLDLILKRAFQDVDDLFARMRMSAESRSRLEVDAHLDGFASSRSKVVPLQVGSLGTRLSDRCSRWLSARIDQHRRCGDARCL